MYVNQNVYQTYSVVIVMSILFVVVLEIGGTNVKHYIKLVHKLLYVKIVPFYFYCSKQTIFPAIVLLQIKPFTHVEQKWK